MYLIIFNFFYLDEEMIQAEEKLEESKRLAEQAMFNVLSNDVFFSIYENSELYNIFAKIRINLLLLFSYKKLLRYSFFQPFLQPSFAIKFNTYGLAFLIFLYYLINKLNSTNHEIILNVLKAIFFFQNVKNFFNIFCYIINYSF